MPANENSAPAMGAPAELAPTAITPSPAGRAIRARLLFNPAAGHPKQSAQRLADILAELHRNRILPELYEVGPDSRLGAVVQNSVRRGIRLVVVAGGDGTVDSVAGAMVGGPAVMGIIPCGTRNNVALSLGIPNDVRQAAAILRAGRRVRLDMGQVGGAQANKWFLEFAALGLVSDLFPLADNIQHGQLAPVGELVSTFISAEPSRLRVSLDGREHPESSAHLALICNTPYLGPHFQAAPDVSFNDGLLDVFLFPGLSKLELVGSVLRASRSGEVDARVQRHRVKEVTIEADPPMALMADGLNLGQGRLTARVRRHALTVIAAPLPAA
jgi:diacylglycerol kinase (ATP)